MDWYDEDGVRNGVTSNPTGYRHSISALTSIVDITKTQSTTWIP